MQLYCFSVLFALVFLVHFILSSLPKFDMIKAMIERKTIISTNLLKILKATTVPLSVSQLMDALEKKDLHPNKTTIYRLLEKLIQSETITEVSVKNGASVYELKTGHHHHFICNSCNEVYCLNHCHIHSLEVDLSKLLPNDKFSIQTHDFNLYGICESCQIS